MKYAEPSHFRKIQTTGNKIIDDWLEYRSSSSQKSEKIKRDDLSIYIRHPKSRLWNLLNDRPHHRWLRETQVNLPNNIIEKQDDHEVEFLKAIMMVELNRLLPDNLDPELVFRVFGNPPQYNLTTYDKLWSLEKIEIVGDYEVLIEKRRKDFQRVNQAFRDVELTDDEVNDEWIIAVSGER